MSSVPAKRLTDVFVLKPVLAVVVNVALLVIGLQSALKLPVQQYPRLESTSIVVTTAYIGADAELIRGFITTPIERAVSAIAGVDYVESSSTAGISTVTVRLKLNHNAYDALAEVNARLNQIRSDLPQNAEAPSTEIVRADRPYATFYLSFTSTQMDATQMSEYLVRHVQPAFAGVPGVQRTDVLGGEPIAMRVRLDPGRMALLDISAADITRALQRNSHLAALGNSEGKAVQIDLLADTDLRSIEEFEQMVVRERAGSVVRLRDVAEVELGSEEPQDAARDSGEECVFLAVWTLPGSNEIDVSKEVNKVVAGLQPQLPAGMRGYIAYDGSTYISHALKEITKTLAETVAIVALVVFLFMGSIRSMLVPLVAIPLSLVGACMIMLVLGFSLNLLTILAIVLAVGLVVDDAIVVVENVERRVREGMPRLQAAVITGRELLSPIIAMTITLAAVYAPIGFQGGLTGMLFREFAFTLAAAVLVSGFVALTLSPVMSRAVVRDADQPEGWLSRFVARRFDWTRRAYAGMLDRVLAARWVVVTASLLIVALIPVLYAFSPSELAPTEDQGEIAVIFESAPDATLDYTVERSTHVVRSLLEFPEATMMWQSMRSDSGFGGVIMKDWGERERTTHQLVGEAYARAGAVPGIRAIPLLPAALPGAGNYDVELVVTSADSVEDMAKYAQQLVGAAFQSGMFFYADTDLKVDLPQARLEIDREKVADLELDLADVAEELSLFNSGNYVNRFNYQGRSYKVIPQLADDRRQSPAQLLDLKVMTPGGSLVPVSAFATLREEVMPRSLNRFQQRNSFKVYGAIIPGVATKEQALAALEQSARTVLPPGYALDYAGESRQIRQEGQSLVGTMGLAVVLIYLVLAAQFGSFRDPLIVLLGSVPLALAGALMFSFAELTTINIYSQIGLVTLVGLIAKNGILIVEFANKLQEDGLKKAEAIREAAAVRLRPVLMTTIATVVGHFPLVLVTGAGAAARNSIGVVLVAGMAIGTLFTIFVVPCLYRIIAATHTAAPSIDAVAAPKKREPVAAPPTGGLVPA